MLEHNETLELIKKAQSGNNDAKTVLISSNLPLVKSIVKRYVGKNVEYDDLMQLGLMGLNKAIDNFDDSFNVRFSTYAVPMIAGEIKRFIRDDGPIKVSRSMKGMSLKINEFVESFRNINNREPHIDEIAREFGMSPHDINTILDSSKYPLSLTDKYDDDNGKSLIDRIPANESTDEMIDKILIKDAVLSLPDRERNIIILRYYRDKTQSEIATIMGVSQVQISRIETKVIEKLKETLIG